MRRLAAVAMVVALVTGCGSSTSGGKTAHVRCGARFAGEVLAATRTARHSASGMTSLRMVTGYEAVLRLKMKRP
jgi:hypothetical protein